MELALARQNESAVLYQIPQDVINIILDVLEMTFVNSLKGILI